MEVPRGRECPRGDSQHCAGDRVASVILLSQRRKLRLRGASQVALVVKNLPATAGDLRDTGSIPRWGRSSGGRRGNPFQYSCLENPMDRGVWWATVQGLTKIQAWLSD